MSPFLVVSVSRAASQGFDMTGRDVALVDKHGFDQDQVSRCSTALVSRKLSLYGTRYYIFSVKMHFLCYFIFDLASVLFASGN